MWSVQDFILLFLCLVRIKRIGRKREFKIPLCNPSDGKLCKQSYISNSMKLQRRSSSAKTANGLNTLTAFGEKLHRRPTTRFQMRIRLEVLWNWGEDGLQVHGIGSRRLVYKEVAGVWSNYKKTYFWWFGNPACGKSTRNNWIEKYKVVHLLDLFEGRGDKEQYDLVCGEPLDDSANAGLCWCLIHMWWVWF